MNFEPTDKPKFIVDENVGKLGRLLRLLGFDTASFKGPDDRLLAAALEERRIILTRDTQIPERRLVTSGQVNSLLIETDIPETQVQQVVRDLKLGQVFQPFSLCLEDNHRLVPRIAEEVLERVPPYVYQTQRDYMECPCCKRIYWKGTHWAAMMQKLELIVKGAT